MKIALASASLLLTLGCASPGYVLGTSADHDDETAPIEYKDGLALVPDRARWVALERPGQDGSVALHYAIQLKNSGTKPVEILTDQIRLKAAPIDVPGIYASKDLAEARKKIVPGNMLRLTARFVLPASAVTQFAGKDSSVELVVPLRSGETLHERLWLWKE